MQGQRAGDALAQLTEGLAIQAEFAQHRLAIEWTRAVIDRLLQKWTELDAYEGIAYEDKLTSQLDLLDDATASLWQLHKTLGRFSRLLKEHHHHLTRTKAP
jgi:hypothetical protein